MGDSENFRDSRPSAKDKLIGSGSESGQTSKTAPSTCANWSPAPLSFASPSCAPARFARLKPTPVRFAPTRCAPVRFAFERSAPVRFATERFAPVRFATERSAPERCAPMRFAPPRSASQRFVLLGLSNHHHLPSVFVSSSFFLRMSANSSGDGFSPPLYFPLQEGIDHAARGPGTRAGVPKAPTGATNCEIRTAKTISRISILNDDSLRTILSIPDFY